MTATTRSGSDVRAETSVDTKLKLKLRRLRLQQLIGENLFPVWIRKKENQMAVHFEIPLFILSFHKKSYQKLTAIHLLKKIFYGYYLNYDIK